MLEEVVEELGRQSPKLAGFAATETLAAAGTALDVLFGTSLCSIAAAPSLPPLP